MLHMLLALRRLFLSAKSRLLRVADRVLYRGMVGIILVSSTCRCALVDSLALSAACLWVGYVGRLAGRCSVLLGVCAGKTGAEYWEIDVSISIIMQTV
jgi:hypothetical protein